MVIYMILISLYYFNEPLIKQLKKQDCQITFKKLHSDWICPTLLPSKPHFLSIMDSWEALT